MTIAVILLLGVYWSTASAIGGEEHPNTGFLATGKWLKYHKGMRPF